MKNEYICTINLRIRIMTEISNYVVERYNKLASEESLPISEDSVKDAIRCIDDFDVKDCFDVLKAVAQEVCPTVVSMVYDVNEKTVYWCEDRNWDSIQTKRFEV